MPPPDQAVRLAERLRIEHGRPNTDTDDQKVARCVYLDYHGDRAQFNADAEAEINGLRFPSNNETPSAANGGAPTNAFVALQFLNPHLNGLPFTGPSGAGVTYIWEIWPRQHTGYHTAFFWANNGDFAWKAGTTPAMYVGAHPYPRDPGDGIRANGTEHDWELAGLDMTGGTDHDGDNLDSIAGPTIPVEKGRRHLQALVIVQNGDGTCTGTFYTDLPDVSNGKVITATSTVAFLDTIPPSPALTIGAAPWSPGNERMASTFGRFKILGIALSQADVLTESSDLSQLNLAAAQSAIVLGKNSWQSVDDLTCDYGTGHSLVWAGVHKAVMA
jgi:hypothetical protein